MMSFAVTPSLSSPETAISKFFALPLQHALARENVAHFRRADAEGQRTKRTVRRGMAVAAHDGLPRLRDAKLRTNHVNDTLLFASHPKSCTPNSVQLVVSWVT